MTAEAVSISLALMTGRIEIPMRGRQHRPKPSFSRLWWHAAGLTPDQRAAGREWYPRAALLLDGMADVYGVPPPIVVHVAATLTPGLRWDRTVRVLQKMLEAYSIGARTWPRGGDATFGYRDREKAWAILTTGDLASCTGPKVGPFAAALSGDTEAIVVDRHLVRLATGADLRQIHPAAMERIRASVRVIAWATREQPAHVQASLWALKAG